MLRKERPGERDHAIDMTEYELMYIVPTTFTEEGVAGVEANVAAILAKAGASVSKTVRLGKFRLAYAIHGQQHGHYALVRFTSESAAMAAVNEALRLMPDQVLRYLILKAEEAGEEKFELVQFQEVIVEGRDTRPRGPRMPLKADARPADRAKEVQAQKEGVAALETGEAAATEVEKLSPEELQKKIDAALEEKA
ncbi:30S ribosomal protein S6 [Candidatus Uhrbacteria bacterium RIFCSPHIGHO2_12_FULL_60_25]|uniref:Small ribosomal subunit protein bS6 n=1 Tax=Candidatus Uhrbacteria bacterium RIFCSPHIGHO2_12_FULL_60_25 TaxID=1802399 RepID=A0A1F7UJ12_9BACT|nr:MAG: 30S ribosomal protein S6 [Candidatus Uhrbacteria bacterium RIFCSPHIGHO2_02_FULL_60_44]OGL78260.1 MAG: 30S ribosomal protein S6 [Candidatus Uhrbacteria bacterium RIFCSPHIGHO2_12_FULL_60_25]